MPHGDRIAELQRLAYGAGTDDTERARAADELEELRREVMRPEGGERRLPGHPDASAPRPASAGDAVGAADAHADPFDALGIVDAAAQDEDRPGTSTATLRWSLVAGAVALAIGFGAGWLSGAQATNDLVAGSVPVVPDSALTFELEPTAVAVPLDQARAMAVFDREQAADDLPGYVDPGFDADTYRRVGLFADGASIHVARALDSPAVCLQLDIRDVGGMSTCTQDGTFPPDGLFAEGGFDSGFYHIEWAESGEVTLSYLPNG
ncbi:hypothetical protein [Agromyces sp. GXS1127]|uniref:hypothetical protein n=1 Tax=Agromyces sp. GXS1127 TaxID=3424181 RepID=UPI003D30FEA4